MELVNSNRKLLETAYAVFKQFPAKFSPFENAAKFELEGTLPNHPVNIYQLIEDDTSYYYSYRKNLIPDGNKPILQGAYNGKFNEAAFTKGLEYLISCEPTFDQVCLSVSQREATQTVKNVIRAHLHNRTFGTTPCNMFYVEDKDQDRFLAIQQPELPEGFTIGDAAEADARLINDTWQYAEPKDILQQREKILRLPSTVIRHNGRPVSFELIGLHAQCSHLYTLPEYRQRGFGKIVEDNLIQKCIRQQLRAHKMVVLKNESVLRKSLENTLWTVAKNEDGSLIIMDFLDINSSE